MKKTLILLFILTIILSGCVKYEASTIKVEVQYPNESPKSEDFYLTEEETEKVLEIINKSKWEKGYVKSVYQYVFVLSDDIKLNYVYEENLLQDLKNDRHTYLTEEDLIYINSLLGYE